MFRVHFERAAYIRLVNWKAGSLFTGHELPEAYQFFADEMLTLEDVLAEEGWPN